MNVSAGDAGERVLVVDDDDDGRGAMCRVLERAGYHVEVASGAKEALARIGGGRFALVLSDVEMPRMGGIELVAQLDERCAAVPVILLTTLDSELVREAVATLPRVHAVVRKSDDHRLLLAAVRGVLVLDGVRRAADG